MNKQKLAEYWKTRNENLFLNGEQDVLVQTNRIKKLYQQALKQIETQINVYYGKYASENGISMEESRKLLTKSELKDFKNDISGFIDYAKNHKLDDDYIKNLRIMQYRAKLSRVEELKAKINFEVQRLKGKVVDETTDILSDTYTEGYYNTIFNNQKLFGFGTDFVGLNARAVQKAILTPYMEENYKDVYWRNNKNLELILNQQIPQGILLGYNPKKVASIAETKLKTDYNKTVRLVRTEYNLILNDSIAAGYKACGIEKYELLATLDSRTSEICQELDGMVVDLNKKEVGINYPPFHPNCRTTTVPYFEPDEIDEEYGIGTRIAKGEDGKYYKVPANTTYKEWSDNLVTDKKGNTTFKSDKVIKKATSDVNEWKNSLSQPEIDALQNYSWKEYGDTSVANFEDINKYLRSGEVSKVGEQVIKNSINYLDSAIDKFKLDKDLIVYRGVDTPSLIEQAIGEKKYTRNLDGLNMYLKNKTLENKAFTSTSLSQKEAAEFGLGYNTAVLRINVPKGTRGAYIDQVSRISREKEFLLGRNTKFNIKSIRLDSKLEKFVINCDLI